MNRNDNKKFKIAVAGTGYVGLSLAVLLSQNNEVIAVDIAPEKVELINSWKSPIQDEYIEKYLKEKELHLTAVTDAEDAFKKADFIIIATPTNYDSQKNFFDTSAVESVIKQVLLCNPSAIMVIKSTVPVGFTDSIREKFETQNILFSPEFLRESKALYDNLYPSRIIIGTDLSDPHLTTAAHTFAELLQEVEKIEGLERIRFMTSHPKDLSDELIEVMKNSKENDLVRAGAAAALGVLRDQRALLPLRELIINAEELGELEDTALKSFKKIMAANWETMQASNPQSVKKPSFF